MRGEAWTDSLRARVGLVCNTRVLRKALGATVVVGSILVFLNQGDVLLTGQVTSTVLIKILLTPLIPFCVTMLGALLNSSTNVRPEELRPGWAAVRRSCIIAVVVGSTIIALNQGDIVLSGTITPLVLAKILLTPCVPFCVSLYGAYIAYRSAMQAQHN